MSRETDDRGGPASGTASAALRVLLAASLALSPLSADADPYFRFNRGGGSSAPIGPPDPSTDTPGAVRGEGDLAVYSPLRIRGRPAVLFSLQLYSTNAVGDVTWTSVGAPLPPGISVSSSGLVSGRPDVVADYPGIQVQGTDAAGRSGTTQPFTIQVKPLPSVTVAASNEVMSGKALTVTPTVTDLYGSQTWTLAGTPPTGMAVDPATGVVKGTPANRGTYQGLVLTVTDSDGAVAQSAPFSILVDGTMTVSGLAGTYLARTGSAIPGIQAFATGNAGPVSWAMSDAGAALPAGLSLDPFAGRISGAVGKSGAYPGLVLRVTDLTTGERESSKPFGVTIGDAPAVSLGTAYLARVGTDFSALPQATGFLGGASWGVSGDLPAGLKVDPGTGGLSGKPLGVGTASGLAATATDLFDGASASTAPFSIRVFPTLTVEPVEPPEFGVNAPMVLPPPVVRGLQGTPTWSLTGSPPAGLTFDAASGVVSGTPTAPGSASLAYAVVDGADGASAKGTVPLRVVESPAFAIGKMSADYPGTVGKAIAIKPTVAGNKGPVIWTFSGTLPGWATFDPSSGAIGGTPNAPALTPGIALGASDGTSSATSTAFNIDVAPADGFSVTMGATLAVDQNKPFSGQAPQVKGASGTPTFALGLGSLPNGLTVSAADGSVGGTTASVGTWGGVTVRATDASGAVASSNPFAVTVSPASDVSVDYASASGTQGTAFSAEPKTKGLTPPLTWGIVDGVLPAWATMDPASGAITGMPTANGSAQGLVAEVDDAANLTVRTKPFSITIADAPAFAAKLSPVKGKVGTAVTATATATGAKGTLTWSIASGTLQAGLALDPASGTVSGTPSEVADRTIALQARDSANDSVASTGPVLVSIGRPDLKVTNPAGPYETHAGIAIATDAPAAAGLLGTPSWSVAGAIPPGMAASTATGVLSGSPTTVGTYDGLAPVATDGFDGTAATGTAYTVNVYGPPQATVDAQPGTVGKSYTAKATATSAIKPLAWTLAAGQLPAWASLDPSSGTISGTPTQVGSWQNLALLVTDAQGQTGITPPFEIDANPADPSVTLNPLAFRARVGVPFASSAPAFKNPNGTVTWSAVSGSPPGWGTVAPSTGIVSGTADGEGIFTFALRGTQSGGGSADSQPLTITAVPQPTVAVQPVYATRVGATFKATPSPANAVTPTQWTLASGTLPSWAKLGASDGSISGTPDAAATESGLALKVVDTDKLAASSAPFSIQVGPGIAISGLPASLQMRQGDPVSLTPSLSNGMGAITWKVAGLPTGASVDPATGTVSGTAGSSGNLTVTFDATDAYDGAKAKTAKVALQVVPKLAIKSDATLKGHTGDLIATKAPSIVGQYGTLTWSMAGPLPSWATVDPQTGIVSGTAGQTGDTGGLTLTATDSWDGAAAGQPFSISVLPPLNVVDMATNYTARYGFKFASAPPTLLNASGSVKWTFGTTTPAPSWIRLDPTTGVMSGTPDALGTTAGLSIVGTDDTKGAASSVPFSVNVYQQAVVTVSPTSNLLRVGKPLNLAPKATGLVGTGTWSIANLTGSLPAGIAIDPASGTLSGTATGPGSATFTIRVTDSADGSTADSAPVTVEANPALTLSGLQPSYVGHAGQSLDTGAPTISNGKGTVTVTASPGAPAGMTLTPEGRLYGIPTGSTAQTKVTLTATDDYDKATGTTSYGLQIFGTLTATLDAEPHLRAGANAAAGSDAPEVENASSPQDVRWSLGAGTLPPGITVDPVSGRLSGTVGSVASLTTYPNVRLTATDPDGRTAQTLAFTVSVAPPLAIAGVPSSLPASEQADAGFTPTASGVVGTAAWSLTGQPPGLVADAASGAVSGQPAAGSSANSPYAATLVLRDSWDGATVPAPFQVAVAYADPNPDPFSFPAVSNAAGGAAVTSATVTLAGMSSPGALKVASGGSYQVLVGVNGATPTATPPATVPANGSLVLQLVAAPGASGGTRTATVTVGTVSATWTVVTADTTPDALTFSDATLVAASTLVASNTATVTGITAPTTVSVSGDGTPQVSVAGGAFAASGTVSNGQTLQLRLTSAASETGVKSTATLNVGGVSATWNVTTRDTVPDPYAFQTLSGQATATLVQSAAVPITGLDSGSPASVTGDGNPQIRIGGQTFPWATTGTVSPGQTVEVRLTTAATQGVSSVATVTIGGVAATFGASTASITAPDSLAVTEGDTVAFSATTTLSAPNWTFSGNPAWMAFSDAGGALATNSVSGDVAQDTTFPVVVTATQGKVSLSKTVSILVRAAPATLGTPVAVRSGQGFPAVAADASSMNAAGTWSASSTPNDVAGFLFGSASSKTTTLAGTAPVNSGTAPVTRTLTASYTGPAVTGGSPAAAVGTATLTVYPALSVAAQAPQSVALGRTVYLPATQVVGAAGTPSWSLMNGSTDVTSTFGTTAALCPGLSFSSQTGLISGTPTATCSLTLAYKVSDSGGGNPNLAATATSAGWPFAITPATVTPSPTSLSFNSGDTVSLSATTSIPTPTWSMTGQPAWLTSNTTGPTFSTKSVSAYNSTTSYTVVIKATNGTLTQQSTVTLSQKATTVTLVAPAAVRAGQPFSAAVSTSMTAPGTWTPTASNADVTNLSIANGSFTGVAPAGTQTTGAQTRTLTATYTGPTPSNGSAAAPQASTTLSFYSPLAFATPGPRSGTVGTSVNMPVTTLYGLSGVANYTLYQGQTDVSSTIGDASRCPGLSFSKITGAITGTPTATCAVNDLSYAATDSGANPNLAATAASGTFAITIATSGLSITPPQPVVEGANVSFNARSYLSSPTYTMQGNPNWVTGSLTGSGTSTVYTMSGTSPHVTAQTTYPITITATSGATTQSAVVYVTVNPATVVLYGNTTAGGGYATVDTPVRSGGTLWMYTTSTMTSTVTRTATADAGVTGLYTSTNLPYTISGTAPANNGSGPATYNVTSIFTGPAPTGTGNARATASATRALTVYPPMQVGGMASSYATSEGGGVSVQPTVTWPIGTMSWTATNLPPGLAINASTGQITGTVAGYASAKSPYAVTVQASDSGSNPSLRTASASVTFTVAPAVVLSASPQALTVAQQTLPDPGACSTVTIANEGSASSSLGVSIDNADFQACTPTGGTPCGTSLAAGGSCVLGYALNAAQAGTETANLTVTGSGGASASATLTGTAAASGTSGFALYTTPGTYTFTPPRPNLTVRYVVVGAGNGGSGWGQYSNSAKAQGGGSGYVKAPAYLTLTGPVTVVVGAAGPGSTAKASTQGGASSFNGYSAQPASWANGFSGGGGMPGSYVNSVAGYGGTAGGNGYPQGSYATYGQAGTGSGSAPDLSMFVLNSLTYGSGGDGGYANGGNYAPGAGGGGGVLVNGGSGPAQPGQATGCVGNGAPGQGWGAGGGGACWNTSTSQVYGPGGAGSGGMVYIEWD